MPERYSPHSFETVSRHNREQYRDVWQLNADARRNLYKYEKRPDDDKPSYDIWEDIAEQLDYSAEFTADLGTNDGYFLKLLLNNGFTGRLVGIDTEADHFPKLKHDIKQEFPNSRVDLIEGDVENLDILSDSFDQAAALFLLYHVPRYRKALSEIHRVVKPGGRIAFAGRGQDNQKGLWGLTGQIAQSFGFKVTDSFYSHFPLDEMLRVLDKDRRFQILKPPIKQRGSLWIPGTEEGWEDYEWAIHSLIPTFMKIDNTCKNNGGEAPSEDEEVAIKNYINDVIRPFFFQTAELNGGFIEDSVDQGFVICQNIK